MTQRAWRASCPNCGAPVEFASAASASAVCGFCRSTLVRDGESLRRIGRSAELFDDHSPLQRGATGRHMGSVFTVVGRLQMGYEGGSWNEWHVVFEGEGGQRSGWLTEDNGAYVIAFEAPLESTTGRSRVDSPPSGGGGGRGPAPGGAARGEVPAPEELHAGEQRLVGGAIWSVASVVRARVLAAEGELPAPPRLDGPEFFVADLRNAADEVGTLDWSDSQRVGWTIGRPVRLAELAMSGLREASEKTLAGRALACPGCGASLEVQLSTTQSIVCGQCHAVVDLSQGVGGDLRHYAQDNAGSQPLIPLGRTGTLALGERDGALPWQVVGYAERCEVDVEAGEEEAAWREYLLYHREEGFAFLVDAEDGWSWSRPITGVPKVRGDQATWQGTSYDKLYSYTGAVTWVLGEFYWRLERGERTFNTDFAAGAKRLNREQVGQEVTWSAGGALDAAVVAKAFGLSQAEAEAMRRDVTPVLAQQAGARRKLMTGVLVLLAIGVLVSMLSECSSGSDCESVRATFGEASNEYRQCVRSGGGGFLRGGSYGGFSSGGSHK